MLCTAHRVIFALRGSMAIDGPSQLIICFSEIMHLTSLNSNVNLYHLQNIELTAANVHGYQWMEVKLCLIARA
jgi:hypothetical protein